MGFWDSVCSFVESVGSAISSGISYVVDKVERSVEAVADFFSGGKKTAKSVGEVESYDRERATNDQVSQINRLLNTYKNDVVERSSRLEVDLRDLVDKIFSAMRDKLERFGADCTTLDLDPIKSKLKNLSRAARKTEGVIEYEVIPKISTDDERCYEILQMDAGSSKTEAMESFITSVLKQALDKQKKHLRSKITGLEEDVRESVEDRVEDSLSMAKKNTAVLRELLNDVEGREKTLTGIGKRIFLARHAAHLFDKK